MHYAKLLWVSMQLDGSVEQESRRKSIVYVGWCRYCKVNSHVSLEELTSQLAAQPCPTQYQCTCYEVGTTNNQKQGMCIK